MAEIERQTITWPVEMAALARGAVDEGSYASSSEVIREALRDWKTKHALGRHQHRPPPRRPGRVQEFNRCRIF